MVAFGSMLLNFIFGVANISKNNYKRAFSELGYYCLEIIATFLYKRALCAS